MKSNKTTKQTIPGPRTISVKYPMNIDQDIYNEWQSHRRKRDVKAISEKINWSVPIVERALNFGHSKEIDVVEKISKFFLTRSDKEKKQFQTLKQSKK